MVYYSGHHQSQKLIQQLLGLVHSELLPLLINETILSGQNLYLTTSIYTMRLEESRQISRIRSKQIRCTCVSSIRNGNYKRERVDGSHQEVYSLVVSFSEMSIQGVEWMGRGRDEAGWILGHVAVKRRKGNF